jgi:8-oxo-dGTP diphosphatase
MAAKVLRNSAKAIIIQDGRLLVLQMVDQEGDFCILPGGGQKHGEPLTDALKRECLEEIGASVRIGRLRLIREYIGRNHEFSEDDGDSHQVEFMFECELEPGATPRVGHEPDEAQVGVTWLPVSELEQHRLYPKAIRTIIKNGIPDTTPLYLGDVN